MSLVTNILHAEIKDRMQKSVELTQKRDNAKEDFSKTYFAKKLAKNNQILSELLEASERIRVANEEKKDKTTESNKQ